MRKLSLVLGVALLLVGANAHAASILIPGPSPVSPLTGTVLDFEGQAEGTIITNQYAGVTFSQTGGGAPMIDDSPFLFAYESASGAGVLTGSNQGGNVATTAGIIATFTSPVAQAGAFMSDTAPLGDYLVQAFGAGNVLLESVLISAAQFPDFSNGACDASSPYTGTGCGVFVGFIRPQGDILSVQFGPSSAARGSDAFAIDDLTFDAQAAPEPATLALMGTGLALALRRRYLRHRA